MGDGQTRRFEGQRVVVAGGSSGIGLACALLFAREGADVVVLARSQTGLDVAVQRLEREGATAHGLSCDVTDREVVERVITGAAERLGGIDVLVSAPAALVYGPFAELSAADFERSFDVTFRGVVNAVRAVLPHLEASPRGRLIVVASMASKVPIPLHSPYVSAKHALRGFLNCLRVELRHARSRVAVCAVHPGFVATPFLEHATSVVGTQPHPLRSIYAPETVAEVVLDCAERPRDEVTVGGTGALLAALTSTVRPLAELVLSTYGVWGQRTSLPPPERGLLWDGRGEGRIHGRYRGRPSLWTALRLRTRAPLTPRSLPDPPGLLPSSRP